MASLTFTCRKVAWEERIRANVQGYRAEIEHWLLARGMRVPKAPKFKMRIRTPERDEHPTHYSTEKSVTCILTKTYFMACYLPPSLQHQNLVVETQITPGKRWTRAIPK